VEEALLLDEPGGRLGSVRPHRSQAGIVEIGCDPCQVGGA
jgi:hypothetical protein